MTKNIISTVWKEKSQFESDNPSGHTFTMFDKSQDNEPYLILLDKKHHVILGKVDRNFTFMQLMP